MVSNVIFVLVLLVAVLASVVAAVFAQGMYAAQRKDAESEKMVNSKKAIHAMCQPTEFKETCVHSMLPPRTSDPKELIRMEFNATVEEIKNVTEHSKTVHILKKDEKTRAALRVCQEVFDWAVQDLERSFDKLGKVDISKVSDILLSLEVWLSGALTSQQTCIDSYLEMNNLAAERMTTILTRSQELTTTGLNILEGLRSISKTLNLNATEIQEPFHRKLLSREFPEWMSYGDRKLLQEKTADIKPDVVVSKDGSEKYETISSALAEVPKGNTKRFVIHVKEGKYEERVNIPYGVSHVMLLGDGPDKTIITANVSVKFAEPKITTFDTATVSADGMNFIAKDIGFENTIGPEGHQAVAVRISGDMAAFYNCRFDGYQDTLYSHKGRQFYRDCTITGTIDFVFGDARAVYQNCKLIVRKPMDNQDCIVIAQGKKTVESASGFVFQNCTFSGDKDYLPVKDKNKSYLNRPWRDFATVIIMQSQIDDIIQPAGYIPMEGDKGLATSYYVEFGNRGAGSDTKNRVKWPGIKQVNEAEVKKFAPGTFLESQTWIPDTGIPCITDMIPGK